MAEEHTKICSCGSSSMVIDSREVGPIIRRRRQCERCAERWTTWESRYKPAKKDLQVNSGVSSEWLAPTRKLSRVTQREIAKRLGRSVSYVSQLEHGVFPATKRVVDIYTSLTKE